MKIGVISDTHSKVNLAKEAIDTLKKENISWLIHAGDIGNEEILQLLEASKIKYIAVFGNNDFHLQSLQDRYK